LSLSEATDDESADLWLLDTPDISITATAPALCRTRPVTTWKAWNRLGQQWSKPRAHARGCVRAAVRRRGHQLALLGLQVPHHSTLMSHQKVIPAQLGLG